MRPNGHAEHLQEGIFPLGMFPLTWFPLSPVRPIGDRAALDRTAVLALTCNTLQASSQKPPVESHTSLVFDQPRWHNHHIPSSHCDGDLPPLFGLQPQILQIDKIPCLFLIPILRSQAHPALCDNACGRTHGMACSPWLLWLRDSRKSTYQLGEAAWDLGRVLQRSTVVVVMTHACLGHDVVCG